MAKTLYPWLEKYWLDLVKQYSQKRLPHAIILSATEGLGVSSLVTHLSQLLLCKSPIDNHACNKCSSCNLFNAGSHPDYHRLAVEETKTQISVDQVRDLIDRLLETAHQSGYRVAVVETAHLMNKNSANAILKTLEEPGNDVLLILLTERLSALPATVRSRCLIINIEAPSEAMALNYVQEHYPDNTATDRIAVRIAQNKPLKALEILNTGILQERQDFFAYLQGLAKHRLEPTSLYKGIKDKKDKARVQTFCDWLLGLLLDAEKRHAGVPQKQLLNSDQGALIESLQNLTVEQRAQWQKSLLESKRLLMTSSNINPKLLLDDMLLNWIAFFR